MKRCDGTHRWDSISLTCLSFTLHLLLCIIIISISILLPDDQARRVVVVTTAILLLFFFFYFFLVAPEIVFSHVKQTFAFYSVSLNKEVNKKKKYANVYAIFFFFFIEHRKCVSFDWYTRIRYYFFTRTRLVITVCIMQVFCPNSPNAVI